MKLTRREKRKIMKVATIGIDIQIASMILAFVAFVVTVVSQMFGSDLYKIMFPATCIIAGIYCLSRIFFDGYIEMAEDIEEGYIR